MSVEPYDFGEQLALSHAAEDLPFWLDVYREAFPTLTACVNHRQDGEHQRAGIDRSLVLANSKQVLIDEKVRGRNRKTGKVYEDIALEYWSDYERRAPGWVCKPLRADYIAYAIAPLGRCYLLPVAQLQQAWRNCGDAWTARYPEIRATSAAGARRWTTLSVGVPVVVLFRAIGACLRVSFTPVAFDE